MFSGYCLEILCFSVQIFVVNSCCGPLCSPLVRAGQSVSSFDCPMLCGSPSCASLLLPVWGPLVGCGPGSDGSVPGPRVCEVLPWRSGGHLPVGDSPSHRRTRPPLHLAPSVARYSFHSLYSGKYLLRLGAWFSPLVAPGGHLEFPFGLR